MTNSSNKNGVLVLGASPGGIGLAIAEEYQRKGEKVIATNKKGLIEKDGIASLSFSIPFDSKRFEELFSSIHTPEIKKLIEGIRNCIGDGNKLKTIVFAIAGMKPERGMKELISGEVQGKDVDPKLLRDFEESSRRIFCESLEKIVLLLGKANIICHDTNVQAISYDYESTPYPFSEAKRELEDYINLNLATDGEAIRLLEFDSKSSDILKSMGFITLLRFYREVYLKSQEIYHIDSISNELLKNFLRKLEGFEFIVSIFEKLDSIQESNEQINGMSGKERLALIDRYEKNIGIGNIKFLSGIISEIIKILSAGFVASRPTGKYKVINATWEEIQKVEGTKEESSRILSTLDFHENLIFDNKGESESYGYNIFQKIGEGQYAIPLLKNKLLEEFGGVAPLFSINKFLSEHIKQKTGENFSPEKVLNKENISIGSIIEIDDTNLLESGIIKISDKKSGKIYSEFTFTRVQEGTGIKKIEPDTSQLGNDRYCLRMPNTFHDIVINESNSTSFIAEALQAAVIKKSKENKILKNGRKCFLRLIKTKISNIDLRKIEYNIASFDFRESTGLLITKINLFSDEDLFFGEVEFNFKFG